MNKIASTTVLLCVTTGALAAPPSQLVAAVQKWSAPTPVSSFEFSLVDLNGDEKLDAVVRVMDGDRCGSGGCVFLVFRGTADGFEKVGDSGYVGRPIYVLKEVNSGWKSLAGMVGLGQGAIMRPIRYQGTEYRSSPIVRGEVEGIPKNYEQHLGFELVEQVAADNSFNNR